MTAPMTLPALATDILAGRHEAGLIEAALNSAFWLHGRHNGTALFLLLEAHARFAEMADAMGYTIAPKVPAENAATPAPVTTEELRYMAVRGDGLAAELITARAKLEAAAKMAEAIMGMDDGWRGISDKARAALAAWEASQ